MTTALPNHLTSAFDLLKTAFPQGVPEAHYLPVASLLSKQLSFRNAAMVLASISGKEYGQVYNEVLKAQQLTSEQVQATTDILHQHGYEQWANELP
jgi:hypothetical protein